MKKKVIFACIILSIILLFVAPAVADYIGPANRTYTETDTYDYGVWARAPRYPCECKDASGACKDCVICQWERQPGDACGDATYWYKLGTRIDEITRSYAPATVSSSFNCSVPGSNGWCRGGATVALSASEPVSGKVITYIENGSGILCDPPDAANVNCNWNPPDGQTNLEFWAHSTYGDTSAKGSRTVLVDSGNPSVNVSIPSPNGQNGWFTNPVVVSASASDPVSGIAASQVRIDNGSWQAGPVTVNAQGSHTAQAQASDQAGNMASSGTVSFKIDSVAPDLAYVIPPVDGQQGWFLTAPMASVSGSDATSGLAAAEIQVDGGNWQSGNMPVTMDGVHTVNFRARDNAGNSKSANATVQVDRTAPDINATIEGTQGQNGWYRSAVRFTPVGSDTASGISSLEAQIGNGPWQTGFPLTLQEGRNDVTVRAADKAGNLTTIPQSILIDVTPPVLTVSVPQPDGQNGWFITAPVVKVAGTDATSGISSAEMRVDGGDWIADGETIEQSGTHTIEFQAQDIAGNVTSQSASIKVDLQGPDIELYTEGTAGQNNWFTSSQVKVSTNVTDLLSGVSQTEFRVDGGSWQTGSEASVQGDGTHQVVFRSTDLAGNISTRTQEVQIDSTAPVVDVNVDALVGLNGWYRSNATVKADVIDPVSGWEETAIRVDGGEWQVASSVKLEIDGVHQLDFQAKDKAGNQARLSKVVKIDQHDPIGYIAEPQGGTRVKGTVRVGGVVHDEMSGIGNIDLSLDEGSTWQKVSFEPDGSWASTWDTTRTTGGMHNLQVRFTDLAGNISTGKLFITVVNNSLSLHLTERWYIWDSGLLEIIPGDIDIISVSIEIIDPLGRWPAEHLEYHQGQQQEVSWDRYFGDILAPVGEYLVRVKVVDVLAQEAEVQGVIVIPPAATPIVTSTVFPIQQTPTATITPTNSATPVPTSTPDKLIPTQVATRQASAVPETPPASHQIPFVYWAIALVTMGFSVVLATTSLTDRRPQELRKLTQWINGQGR